MSEWKIITAEEFCDSVRDGTHDTPKPTESGYKLVTGKHLKKGVIDDTDAYYISESDYNKINERSKVDQWDVLMSMIGTVGEVAVVKNKPCYAIKNVALFKCAGSELKGRWLAYYLNSPKAKGFFTGNQKGSSQQFLSLKQLRNLPILVTEEPYMKYVVDILSRYDSLIENYQKQIKLLEEAAQRLYKEWFVDLHFPGHENTKIVNGVPEGWEKKPALDFFEMSIGKTPPRAQKQWFTKGNNGIPWVSISDMKETMFVQETAEELTQDACENYNIKVVPRGTILLSFKLTVGRVAFAGADVCTNEAIAHFQKEGDEWKAYTLMYLRNYNYDSLGNTSGISKAVNSTIIKNMPFVMPCTSILQEFSQRVLPFIKQTENLQSQIRLLTEARDRLLPKLMNGEIKV